MIWLSWRQQRAETVITAAVLAVLTLLFLPSGLHLASLYQHDQVAQCVGKHTQACFTLVQSFSSHEGIFRSVIPWLNLVPGLLGVALAAPVLLDVEQGTLRLAWTQSVTRGRWLSTKLGLVCVTALLAGGAISLLFAWYRRPLDALYGRWDSGVFDLEGTVPLAYVLFGFAVTLAIGVVWRRAAAAAVVGFVAYVGARLFVQSWLRQRFFTPLSQTWGFHASGPNLTHAWVISSGLSDRAGHPFSGGYRLLSECAQQNGGVKTLAQECLARHGAGYTHAVWQPASRFWDIQGLETALFCGVAFLLTAFATWRLLRAD